MADAEVDENNNNCSIVWRYFEKTLHNNEIFGIYKKEKCTMHIKCASESNRTLQSHLLSCYHVQNDKMLAKKKKRKNEKEVR